MTKLSIPQNTHDIVEIVRNGISQNSSIEIIGAGTKRSWGRDTKTSVMVDLSNIAGITLYEPQELVLTANAGTPIEDIQEVLSHNNQQLAFEPTDFGPTFHGKKNFGTLGGVMSCNFAGPRRFKAGSVRDHILGFKGVNGKGDIIKSGGTVVKNVTGYDLSKILSGSFGTLTVLTEIAVKVLPKPLSNKTIVIDNPHLKNALKYLNVALSSSSDPSGAVFYPDYFRDHFLVFTCLPKPRSSTCFNGSALSSF